MKNEQNRLSNGMLTHERLEYETGAGKYRTVKQVSVCRRTEITATNNPHELSAAIASRACLLPLTLPRGSDHNGMTTGTAIATATNSVVNTNREAWMLFLRTVSSLQVRPLRPTLTVALPSREPVSARSGCHLGERV
jgi:hypothetical protein